MPPKKNNGLEKGQTTLDAFRKKAMSTVPISTAPQPNKSPAQTSALPASVAPVPPIPAPIKTGSGGSQVKRNTVCKYFLAGKCKDGSKCSYLHPQAPSKTICRYYVSEKGCKKGAGCPDLHYNDFGFGVVKVPWSAQYTYESGAGKTCQHWKQIIEVLSEVEVGNTTDLEELLTTLLPVHKRHIYTTEFSSLQDAIDLDMDEATRMKFFSKVLPWMQQQVIACPSRFPNGIPLLRQQVAGQVVLTQIQVMSLLACCFFNIMPFRHKASREQYTMRGASSYAEPLPYVNMGNLFNMGGTQNRAKIRCMLEYFMAMHDDFAKITSEKPYHIQIIRMVCPTQPTFQALDQKLVGVEIVADGVIEDRRGVMQADFANKMLGGGVLGRGCVQEEIRFVISPECLLSRIICEKLQPNEAVIINGAEQFSDYTGYASEFRFAKRAIQPHPTAQERHQSMRNVCIVAMDAVDFGKYSHNLTPVMQYYPHWVARETLKAFTSFNGSGQGTLTSSVEGPIATGNWGCGAFAGDVEMKLLIQLVAASAVGRPLIYFTFGNEQLVAKFKELYAIMKAKGVTAGALYTSLADYHTKRELIVPETIVDEDATPSMEDLEMTDDPTVGDASPMMRRQSTQIKIVSVFEHVLKDIL